MIRDLSNTDREWMLLSKGFVKYAQTKNTFDTAMLWGDGG